MQHQLTNQSQVRASFWEAFPDLDEHARKSGTRSKRQNEQCADIRCTFVDYVDSLQKDGTISEALADRVTL